jgi:hypothetical protein
MESPPPLVLTRSVSRPQYPASRSSSETSHSTDSTGSASTVLTHADITKNPPQNNHDEGIGEANTGGGGGTVTANPSFLQRVVSNTAPIVPRKKRRGLLANLSLVPEVERPLEYEFPVKVLVTCVVAAAGASAPMASGILYREFSDLLCFLGFGG